MLSRVPQQEALVAEAQKLLRNFRISMLRPAPSQTGFSEPKTGDC